MSPSADPVRVWDEELPDALTRFDDASLELLNARALLRRVDRKYLLPKQVFDDFLRPLADGYRVLKTAGRPAGRYRTKYFDTPDRQMFQDHRRGRLPRYKVRARHHLDREKSFLEIKRKQADGRTAKSVMNRPFLTEVLDREALDFIRTHCPIDSARLVQRASIEFCRATLVGQDIDERITIDWALSLCEDERHESLPHLVIVEVKQARFSRQTPAVRILRDLHVRERSISKYCLATARLAAVRTNTLRPGLLAVEKLLA